MFLGKHTVLLSILLLALACCGCTQPDSQDTDTPEEKSANGQQIQQDSRLEANDPSHPDYGLPRVENTSFVGRADCFSCHRELVVGYRRTAHDLAGAEMDSSKVLGDFDNARYSDEHGSASFSSRDGNYYITTAAPGEAAREYELAWCVGGKSLQQYALKLDRGHIQVLDIAWDARPEAQGGQRWFRLPAASPHERSGGGDWTGWNANWNTNCASCHASGVKIRYEPTSDSFDTMIVEDDVSCESCHGGGKIHVGWADGLRMNKPASVARKGLIFYLTGEDYSWEMHETSGNARRNPPRTQRSETETCMRCHSLHRTYVRDILYDRDPLHFIDIELLTEGHFHPDGQIADVQVYETASFLQSREYVSGVSCSDCHDPHTGETWESGNDLCMRCHSAAKYDTAEHHFHEAGSTGSQCISCHMDTVQYLGADTRHDHSFRIPRPDLSRDIGTPNACSSCHSDMELDSLISAYDDWYGAERKPHFGTVLATARSGDPRSIPRLEALAQDFEQAPIVRATAFHELGGFASPTSLDVIRKGLLESESIVRLAAARACRDYPLDLRAQLLLPHVSAKLISLNIETGGMLAGLPTDGMDEDTQRALLLCIDKYISSQQETPWLPVSHAREGWALAMLGNAEASAEAFERMDGLSPLTAECFLLQAQAAAKLGNEDAVAGILSEGLSALPGNAELLHAIAGDAARRGDEQAAMMNYRQALEADPELVAAAASLAAMQAEQGNAAAAITVLEDALVHSPYDPALLSLLIQLHNDSGNGEKAARIEAQFAEYYPWLAGN